MPDQPDADRVLRYVKEKWTQSQHCPVCAESTWNVNEVASLQVGMGVLGGKQYPLVPVFCTNCGYTVLFNAVIGGLVEPEPPPEPVEESGEDES